MKHIAAVLQNAIAIALPNLQAINNENASIKPQIDKWSHKEIIGHLIDSACNNHQKMVRTMANQHLEFVGYQQNFWVEIQQYNQANWHDLLSIWQGYNLQIAHIMSVVDSEVLQNTITIDGTGPFALQFIMEDYPQHLIHHVKQILPDIDLTSRFVNVYNA